MLINNGIHYWTEYFENVSRFSIAFLYHDWNGARLLSPQSDCRVALRAAEQLETRGFFGN